MNLEIHYADEWAALYVDGRLDRVGEAYVTEERALDLAGVTVVRDESFMRGQTQYSGVAQTVAEVAEYRQRREDAKSRATALREQAQALRDEADRLEGESK